MGGPRSQAQVERSGTRAQLQFGFHQQQIGNKIKPHRSLEPGCLQHVGNVPSGSSGGLSTNGPAYITQHVKWISIHSSNIYVYTYTEIENLNITEQHGMTNSGDEHAGSFCAVKSLIQIYTHGEMKSLTRRQLLFALTWPMITESRANKK